MTHCIRRTAPSICAALVLSLACATARAREKVDVIVVNTGDRITGEIAALAYGRLSVKTDYMDTVQIEWLDVVSVNSKQLFTVEDVHGNIHYGTLTTAGERGPISIGPVAGFEDSALARLKLDEIARISPAEQALLSRLHGSFSVGFDYAKSSDITTLTASADFTYRGTDVVSNLGIDVNSTKDPTQGTIDRDSIVFDYRWLRPHAQFWAGLASFERNEETGIEARLIAGGGWGKYLLQSRRSELSALVGIVATEEWATGEADSQSSIEGLIGADWRIFQFSTPKVSLVASGTVFPSITESGRYRTNLNLTLRREIISDLYLDLSFYNIYDNQPPDVTAEKSDYGITTSLGYSFN